MSINQRIKILREQLNLTQEAFGEKVGLSRSSLGQIEIGKQSPTLKALELAVKNYHTTLDWLFFGTGDMLVNSDLPPQMTVQLTAQKTVQNENSVKKHIKGDSLKIRTLVIATDKKGNELLQFVPSTAFAGYLTGFSDPEYIEKLPALSVSGMLPQGTYRGFEVKGDSMEPTYKPGDKLIARYVEDWTKLVSMNTFVIVTNNDIVVKRVENRLKTENRLIFHSDNKYYPEYDIEVEDIREVWRIEAYMRVGQTAPTLNIDALRTEIEQLKQRLNDK